MKNCKNCNACKKLYRRYFFRYFLGKHFYCIQRKEITMPDNICDKWTKKIQEYDLSPKRFDKAERDIKFLQKYL